MIGLTRRQLNCLAFIKQYIADRGFPPSFDEMKDHLGLRSKSGIHRIIGALEERGLLRRLHNRARALEVVDPSNGTLSFLPRNILEWVQHGAHRRAISVETLVSEIVSRWAVDESTSTRRPIEQARA